MTKVKNLVTLLLTVLMLMSCGITAHAATKPSVRLESKTTISVKRGKSTKHVFILRSGSYTKKSGVWRAKFYEFILKNPNDSNTMVGYGGCEFTGNIRYTMKWAVPKKLATGKYTSMYGTWYRKNASTDWRISSAGKAYYKVK